MMKQITLNEAAAICFDSAQAVPILVDGKEKLYLMTEAVYNDYAQAKLAEEIFEGVDQIERGQYTDGETFEKEIHTKYGI